MLRRWVDLAQTAAQIATGLTPQSALTAQQDAVTSLFQAATSLGLNIIRVFGHGDATFQLQTGPGDCRSC